MSLRQIRNVVIMTCGITAVILISFTLYKNDDDTTTALPETIRIAYNISVTNLTKPIMPTKSLV